MSQKWQMPQGPQEEKANIQMVKTSHTGTLPARTWWPAHGRALGSDGAIVQGPTDGHVAVPGYAIRRKSSM